MRYGFVKVATSTPDMRVADCEFNASAIKEMIMEAEKQAVKVLVLPELCITGYTCGDLFLQETLLACAKEKLVEIARFTKGMDVFVVVGLPFVFNSKLYNTAAALQDGKVLGMVPKHSLPNYAEFYESRHFACGKPEVEYIELDGKSVPFGMDILFQNVEQRNLIIAIEICEDLWTPQPPSGEHVLAGATMILNLSASNELAGKASYRRELVKNQSARLVCGYVYADAGEGESTTDLVFAGHNLIVENGTLLGESAMFENGMIVSEIDVDRIISERRRMTSYATKKSQHVCVEFSYGSLGGELPITPLTRHIASNPFVPDAAADRKEHFEEVMMIQAVGLKKRLKHINCKCAIVGVSGGLDSALALLITKKAFELSGLDTANIIAVTMPCFGTSRRTYDNALILTRELGIKLIEIDIKPAVLQHFADIGQQMDKHDLTYENSQARERTQILMDMAGKYGGIVIGTGDLSELALGWATYNGDHMSMYGVNASVPKTLVRELVKYVSDTEDNSALSEVLRDILDTPVSPELLPPGDGKIVQKTEDLVGPYELHDFFIYYMIRYGFSPSKIYRLACIAFEGTFGRETIYKWLSSFYRRFFTQQFKRSCLPDGPKVGSVALSPRGDWRMPSDACMTVWLEELENARKVM